MNEHAKTDPRAAENNFSLVNKLTEHKEFYFASE